MLHVLELGARRREQFLGRLDVPVHRAADVEEQQHLHRIVPLRPHLDVEIALVRGALDGAVEIEFVGRAGARELAQAPQRDLDVAGAEFDVVVEILELALVPDLHRAAMRALAADADAFRVVAAVAERRGAAGADPFRCRPGGGPSARPAACFSVSSSLSRPPIASICFFSSSVRYFSASFFSHSSGISAVERLLHQLEALEDVAEHAVELVEVALVLHQRGARQIVEVLDPPRRRGRPPSPPSASGIRAASPARRRISARGRR